MKNKEYFKDFDDFDDESQQMLKEIYDSKQILNVKDISREIWKNTYKNTTVEEPTTPDDYKDDFYGAKSDEGIKLPDLVKFLSKANLPVKFDWTHFKAQQSSMSFPNPYGFGTEIKLSGNIPFTYTNDNGKKVQTNITGLMNKRVDYIESVPYFSLNVDSKSKYLNCSLIYFYQNTAQYRQQIPITASKTDFTVNNKYKAVQFSSNNLDDLANLAKNLKNDNAWFKEMVNRHFLPLLRKENTVDGLIFLYRSSPDWVLQNLTAEELWAHLITFFNYDENHGFKDASDVLVKTLLGYNSVEKLTFLFDKLNADQAFIKRIYSALDGNAVFQDQELPTKTIFSSFLVSLCYMNMAKCKIRNKVFKIGKDYKIDSNVWLSNDKFKDQYFLQQQEDEQLSYNSGIFSTIYSPSIGIVDTTTNLDAGNYYYPLELVTLEDVSEAKEPENKDAKTKDGKAKKTEPKKILVPAIFVKDIAHLTEFKEITDDIRLGVDIIVVALSVASLGSASPLVVLVSALDMAIAGGDILVLMNEDKFSKEFLETWNLVVMAGGAATAAPFLIKGLFRAGALVFTTAGRAEVMTFVKTCLMKTMLEKNIANFTGSTVKEIIFGAEALKLAAVKFNFAGITRLQEAGVLFAKGVGYDGKTVGYVVFYDGEVIAQGSAKEIRESLKDLWKAEKSELKTKLSGLFRNKIFTKYATKFEKKFHLHFDGEILIKEKGQEEILELFGAHNHDLVGTKIQIGTIRKPSGIKSIHDLPNDVPFKANVEIKYNSSVVKKRNTSSFFPKNWDIKRVKEEIALVYDEMLKSGKVYNPNATNRKFDFPCSNGSFRIQIEFDELGNLTSAYPIVN